MDDVTCKSQLLAKFINMQIHILVFRSLKLVLLIFYLIFIIKLPKGNYRTFVSPVHIQASLIVYT